MRRIWIAQLSDFHLGCSNHPAYENVNSLAALARAIATVNALTPLPVAVLGTGDLTHSGAHAEYEQLSSCLSPLCAPFLPVLGNHDERSAFRRSFANAKVSWGPLPFAHYVAGLGDLTVIALDTVDEGKDAPAFSPVRAAWLDSTLAQVEGPIVLAMHHPPFSVGIDWLDPADTDWAFAIADLVKCAGKVKKIVCGHVHRSIHRNWCGVSTSISPSTAHQVLLDLTPGALPQLSHEAAGFLMHHWDGEAFTTYHVSPHRFADAFSPLGLSA